MLKKISVLFLFFFLALIALFFLRFKIAVSLASFLISDSPFNKAYAAVVLTGSQPSRILEAVDLYKEGFAEKIILTNGETRPGASLLKEKGIEIPNTTDIDLIVALGLGVKRSDIIVIKEGANSTYQEAVLVLDFAVESGVDSLLIVSSKSHTKRAEIIFNHVAQKCFQSSVRLFIKPSRYDNFEPGMWWRFRSGVRQVAWEYQKLAYFYLFERNSCG